MEHNGMQHWASALSVRGGSGRPTSSDLRPAFAFGNYSLGVVPYIHDPECLCPAIKRDDSSS
jgi:hypothetical protein